MAFVTTRELKRLVHPHYLINILLALSFLVLKKTPNVCTKLFRDGCELTSVSVGLVKRILLAVRTPFEPFQADCSQQFSLLINDLNPPKMSFEFDGRQ